MVPPLDQAPQLSPASRTNGMFALRISGDSNLDYTVQASTNLTLWTNLFSTNIPALPFLWVDTNTDAGGKRFYRLLLGP